MTKYTDDSDNHFNSIISDSVQELKKGNICYVYTEEQANAVKKVIYKKLKRKIEISKNECGYTLRLRKEKMLWHNVMLYLKQC